MTTVPDKANILNDYFVEQCCIIEAGSYLPNFWPIRNSVMESINFNRGKVLHLIHVLGSKKPVDVTTSLI